MIAYKLKVPESIILGCLCGLLASSLKVQAGNFQELTNSRIKYQIRPSHTVADLTYSRPIDSLTFLRSYNGKYPYQVKLLDHPALKRRMEKLLGSRFAFLKKTWAVEIPMKVSGNQFSASACQTHNCSSTNFMIVVDLAKNVLYAGIREEGKVTLYSEDGSHIEIMDNWARVPE